MLFESLDANRITRAFPCLILILDESILDRSPSFIMNYAERIIHDKIHPAPSLAKRDGALLIFRWGVKLTTMKLKKMLGHFVLIFLIIV